MRMYLPGTFGDTWTELTRMQREMDRMFDRFGMSARSRVFPPINIYESEDQYLLRAELPGIDASSLDVTVARNELVLKGERVAPPAEEGSSVHRRERTFGRFARSFTLPDSVDPDQVQADYRDGVLAVTLRKHPAVQPRQIAVSTHEGGRDDD